jgi:hypothetical protein
VVARFDSGEDTEEWRAAMRRACRAAGLRVRTGLANADERIVWAWHVDHELTEAGERAARRAMEAAYNGEPRVPFHELVREEQRKMLRVVGADEAESMILTPRRFSYPGGAPTVGPGHRPRADNV